VDSGLKNNGRKVAYTVTCSSSFRDRVLALAERRHVNVADLARSVLLLVPETILAAVPDPGEPLADDREKVVLKSGPSAGKPWQRKPRLQVRLAPGHDPAMVRRALSLALQLDDGTERLHVGATAPRSTEDRHDHVSGPAAGDGSDRLWAAIETLGPDLLPYGVRTRSEALYVLGYPPGSFPQMSEIRVRFRKLASILHPDSGMGDHRRMSQLNAAMEVLFR